MVDVGPLGPWSVNHGHPLRRLANEFDELGEYQLADLQRDLADTLDPPDPPPACPRCRQVLDDVDSVEVRSFDGTVHRTLYDPTAALAAHRPDCPGPRTGHHQ